VFIAKGRELTISFDKQLATSLVDDKLECAIRNTFKIANDIRPQLQRHLLKNGTEKKSIRKMMTEADTLKIPFDKVFIFKRKRKREKFQH
jgi:hypothetical protein